MGWLKKRPNSSCCREAGQTTPTICLLKRLPSDRCSTEAGQSTPAMDWLNRRPNAICFGFDDTSLLTSLWSGVRLERVNQRATLLLHGKARRTLFDYLVHPRLAKNYPYAASYCRRHLHPRTDTNGRVPSATVFQIHRHRMSAIVLGVHTFLTFLVEAEVPSSRRAKLCSYRHLHDRQVQNINNNTHLLMIS